MGREGSRSTDYTGRRYGKLVALSREYTENGCAKWLVRCDCGVEKVVYINALVSGKTISCGCVHREVITKHGMEGTKIYNVWASMLQRCRNPKHRAFKNYGGRGITVCERWHDFRNFYADMGAPSEGKSLDRRDNAAGYSPENCWWATWEQQARNRRPARKH